MLSSKIAIYPGSFDPVTYGHIDIIDRASKVFDKLIIAVAHNTEKVTLFTVQERLEMLKRATRHLKNIAIDDFNGLTVDYARNHKSKVIIRGIRMISDFEYEFQLALMNRNLSKNIETIFMMPSESSLYISSKLIKEAAALGADVKRFVPDFVAKEIEKRICLK